MEKALLAGIFTLAASVAGAQVEQVVSEPIGAGEPANLCQELLAFVKTPPPEAAAASAPSTKAGATQSSIAPAAPTEESVASESEAAGENSAQTSGKTVPPQSVEKTQSAQEASGQAGPAIEAPEPNSESVETGKAENAELKSGLSAPVPTDATSVPKSSVLSMADAEELADANDIAACQTAGRELRLAGTNMPPPLLALIALDLRYQQ